jgi:putative ABC transport system permease protein
VSNPALHDSLKESAGRASAGLALTRLRGLLVVSEVALAFVLLVGAGLLLRSFVRVQRTDPGFRPEGLLTAWLSVSERRYRTDESATAFFLQVVERIRATPGVVGAAAVTTLPMNPVGIDHDIPFLVEGQPPPPTGQEPQADFRITTPGYFRVLGMRVLRGRDLTDGDHAQAQRVVVINQTMARRFFPNEDPLGKRITFGATREPDDELYAIVGVVSDVRHRGLDAEPRPEVYVSPHHWPSYGSMHLLVRTAGDPAAMAPAVKQAVYALDPNQPLGHVLTMPQLVSASVAHRRFNAMLIGTFAGVGVLLAAIGIYGVMAYAVSRRTREIGIRVALGAEAGDVVALVVRQGLAPVALGIGVGIAGALALTRLLQTLLHGVRSTDPVTYAAVTLFLAAIALLATYVPARRASRVDPLVALRVE